MMSDNDALQPEENLGGEEREKKEDNCSKASSAVSNEFRMWYWLETYMEKRRDEQIAFLEDVLKCDKPKFRSMHEFSNPWDFYAFLTEEEAEKLSELDTVEYIRPGRPRRIKREAAMSRRKINTGPKIKKQKLSIGHRLSEERKNKEKWRYYEGLEPMVAGEVSEDGYCSSDSSGSVNDMEYYYVPFDATGKRWYVVGLVNDMEPDDHKDLLLTTLNWSESEIDSIYMSNFNHLFEAYMTEEEADKVAGEGWKQLSLWSRVAT